MVVRQEPRGPPWPLSEVFRAREGRARGLGGWNKNEKIFRALGVPSSPTLATTDGEERLSKVGANQVEKQSKATKATSCVRIAVASGDKIRPSSARP